MVYSLNSSAKLMAPITPMAPMAPMAAFGAPERFQPQAFANLVRLLHRQTILRRSWRRWKSHVADVSFQSSSRTLIWKIRKYKVHQSSTGKTRLEIDWKSDFHLYPTDKASTNAWRTILSYKIIATLTTTWDMIIAGIDFSRDLISLSLESLKSAHQTSKPRLVVLWMACSSLFICLIGLSSCFLASARET